MKKSLLLLFTLLSACCYGQDMVIIKNVSGNPNPAMGKDATMEPANWNRGANAGVHFYTKPGTTTHLGMGDTQPKPKVLSLEEKLLLYAQECWEDSSKNVYTVHITDDTTVYGGTPCRAYIGFPERCNNQFHHDEIRSKYIHREPTFQNFIEWLKKK